LTSFYESLKPEISNEKKEADQKTSDLELPYLFKDQKFGLFHTANKFEK
jgi:hypothetical protein